MAKLYLVTLEFPELLKIKMRTTEKVIFSYCLHLREDQLYIFVGKKDLCTRFEWEKESEGTGLKRE